MSNNDFSAIHRGLVVDLFSCAGGASVGLSRALGRAPDMACNHDPEAIRYHEINHPDTVHYPCSVWELDPLAATKGQPVDWLHASPDCTYFSRAKGSRPLRHRERRVRSLAWVILRWCAQTQPRVVTLENVPEFVGWGPVRRGKPVARHRGRYFDQFIGHLRGLGYHVDWRILRASDFGAATRRDRLFVVARRDGIEPQWPIPTHGRPGSPERTIGDCLDYSLPCPSLFLSPHAARAWGVRRPLARSTSARIAQGVRRYIMDCQPAPEPTVPAGGWSPMQEIAGVEILPFIAKHYTGVVGHGCDRPLGTITCTDHHSLVMVTTVPLRELSPAAHDQAHRVADWLVQQGVCAELPQGMVMIGEGPLSRVIVDIGMRMLQPTELAEAQGFPRSYALPSSKTRATFFVGNSVSPPVMEALVLAQGTPACLRLAL